MRQLYGPSVMRPNHHYSTHVSDYVLDFGPLREFWTFLFERINKILKSYKANNHADGEVEVTFFREFHRTVRIARLVRGCKFLLAPLRLSHGVFWLYH